MLNYSSGKLLDVCKQVVSFDIFLPSTQVSLLPRARCNSYCRRNCIAQKKTCGLYQQGIGQRECRLQTSWQQAQKMTQIMDRVVMKESNHISRKNRNESFGKSKMMDDVGKRLSSDDKNATVQKIMRAIRDQGMRCSY